MFNVKGGVVLSTLYFSRHCCFVLFAFCTIKHAVPLYHSRRMAAYLQHVTQFHVEGRSLEIHTKHHKNNKKRVKNQDYGVQDKDVAMQQVAIV